VTGPFDYASPPATLRSGRTGRFVDRPRRSGSRSGSRSGAWPGSLVLALTLALACAHRPPTPSADAAAPADADLLLKNDEELFSIGSAAAQAGDDARAAASFGRLADAFPASPRAPAALHGAGLAERRLARWRPALRRLERLIALGPGPAADEARFLAAECRWRLGERGEARALLDGLAAQDDLAPGLRLRASAERAVLDLEDGDAEAARRGLEAGLAAWGVAGERARLDPRESAMARFYLGEANRARFLSAPLDPARGDAALLERELEAKSSLLLAAQEQYLAAMRTGDPAYGVAAGTRVGDLYDELHQQLTEAPVPLELDAAQAAAYRTELAREVAVLSDKAVVAYEETLSAARRAGVDNDFVERAEEALTRLRQGRRAGSP